MSILGYRLQDGNVNMKMSGYTPETKTVSAYTLMEDICFYSPETLVFIYTKILLVIRNNKF